MVMSYICGDISGLFLDITFSPVNVTWVSNNILYLELDVSL